MASDSPDGAIPDYNARLGYGTDQGRWLQQQVSDSGGGRRRERTRGSPARVYHELDAQPSNGHHEPAAADPSGKSKKTKPPFLLKYAAYFLPMLLSLVLVVVVVYHLHNR